MEAKNTRNNSPNLLRKKNKFPAQSSYNKLNFFVAKNIVDCSRDNYINSLEKSIMTTSSKGNWIIYTY